jgi:hypothetical protein
LAPALAAYGRPIGAVADDGGIRIPPDVARPGTKLL